METFWFLWLRFSCAFDSANDSDFSFSPGYKRSYDSAYDSDSDSVASENQPLVHERSELLGIEELQYIQVKHWQKTNWPNFLADLLLFS